MEFLSHFLRVFMEVETRNRQSESNMLNAVDDMRERLKFVAEAGDDKSEAICLIKLGNIYAHNSEFDLSDTMYRQGLAIARALPDQHLEIVALANLGLSYKNRMDYSQAFGYYQKAMNIAKKSGDQNFEQEILKLMDELTKMIDLDKSANSGK